MQKVSGIKAIRDPPCQQMATRQGPPVTRGDRASAARSQPRLLEHLYQTSPDALAPILLPPGLPVPLRVQGPSRCCALLGESVAAGFPSPADDYVEARIDLNLELIPSPLSTFFMRVEGDAMRGDGIVDGDLLVIDRSLEPRVGLVVVAIHDGSFILRRLGRREGRLWLLASDALTPPLPLASDDDRGGQLWGVAIHAIHHLCGAPSRRH